MLSQQISSHQQHTQERCLSHHIRGRRIILTRKAYYRLFKWTWIEPRDQEINKWSTSAIEELRVVQNDPLTTPWTTEDIEFSQNCDNFEIQSLVAKKQT